MEANSSPPLHLYKYVSDQGIDLLRSWRIKITPPKDFNDPFELLPSHLEPRNRRDIKSESKDKGFQRAVYNAHLSGVPGSPSFKEWRQTLKKEGREKELTNRVIGKLETKGAEFGKLLKETVFQHFGIVSLSETWDNLLMWSHYSSSHRGFVVEVCCNDPIWKKGYGLFSVTYSRERAPVKLSPNPSTCTNRNEVIELIRRKYERWEYEKEWRAVFSLSETEKVGETHYLALPDGIVSRVFGGCQMGTGLEQAVRSACAVRNIPFRKLRVHESGFRLE